MFRRLIVCSLLPRKTKKAHERNRGRWKIEFQSQGRLGTRIVRPTAGPTRAGANLALGGEKRANAREAKHRNQATRRRAGCQSLVVERVAGSAGWRRSHLLP